MSPGSRCTKGALFFASLCLLVAAPAQAAPIWLPAADLSAAGKDASNPVIASDDAGSTIVLWERQHQTNPSLDVQFAARSPSEALSAPADLSLSSNNPIVAMAPNGEAAAAWRHFVNPPGNYVIQVAARSPGEAFSPPVNAAGLPVGVLPNEIRVAVNRAGDTAVTWTQVDPDSGLSPNPPFVMASVRPAGGTFSTPVRLSPPRPERADPEPGETEKEKEEREKQEDEEAAHLEAGDPSVAIDAAGEVIVVWAYFDGTNQLVQGALRPAAGSFSGLPIPISDAGKNAGEVEVAVDDAGDATVAWVQIEGPGRTVHAAVRPAAGSFPAGEVISSPTAVADSPEVRMTPSGLATIAWRRPHEGNATLEVATRPAAGSFSAPEPVPGNVNDHPQFPRFALSGDGDVVLVWSESAGTGTVVAASVRPAAGSFSAPKSISASSTGLFHPTVAIDEDGSATAVWVRSNGENDIVQAARLDALAPGLRDVSIPASGTVGVPISFSATPFDDWPIDPATFNLGDGTEATGNSVAHTYSAPGNYSVTVTARDAVGSPVSEARTIAIAPRTGFSIGGLRLNRKKGTATLLVSVEELGTLILSGRGVRKVTKSQVEGNVGLPVGATGRSLRRLERSGRLKTELKVAFTPRGGATQVGRRKATLVKAQG